MEGSIGASAVTVSGTDTILATDAAASFGSTLTMGSGAILAAGDAGSAGTATITGATTFNNGSIFSWDIDSLGTSYDKLETASIAGEATTGNAVFRVVLADSALSNAFWNTDRTWTNIITDGTNALADWTNLFTLAVVDSSFNTVSPTKGSFTLSGSSLNYSFAAIPEPTSALAGLLLAAGLMRRRRK